MSKIKKIPKGSNNMNYDNKGSIDWSHYLTERAIFAIELLVKKGHDLTLHQNAVSYYNDLKNITFEIEEKSEAFKELKETLHIPLKPLPVHEKKINVSRIVEEYEKSIASVEIKNIKRSFPINTVEKELLLQNDFCFEAPETLKIYT